MGELNSDIKTMEKKLQLHVRSKGANIYPIDIKLIQPKDSIRLKCLVPLCQYYGVSKVCPPNIPEVAEFKKVLESYNYAYLVVLKEQLDKIDANNSPEIKLNDIMAALDQIALEFGQYQVLGLASGGCKFCEKCTPIGEPCLNPYKARPSPSGFGIDITKVALEAGVSVEWPLVETVTFMGLVLI